MPGSYINSGSISNGLTLTAGGYLDNTTTGIVTFYGAYDAAVLGIGGASSVTNAGSIVASGSHSSGVRLEAGGSVANTGTIGSSGPFGYGVKLDAGGSVINGAGGATTALIEGSYGIFATTNGLTLANYGTIAASYDAVAVYSGAGGFVTNGASGSSGGLLEGGIRFKNGSGTVANNGTINAFNGVYLYSGGSLINASGALIQAYRDVYIGGGGTVTNSGVMVGTHAIVVNGGGTVSNAAGGLISSSRAGVYVNGGGSVANLGTIDVSNNGRAVSFYNDGNVTNGAVGATDAVIKASGIYSRGIVDDYGSATVTNYATISAGLHAVQLGAGGSVTNAAGGVIESNGLAVDINGGSGTVVNAGTIIGDSGAAIALDRTSGGLVVFDPGAVFKGTVSGGSKAVGVLELASTASVGTLSGLGMQFVDFGSITVDSGATWLLSGNNTLASGATLTNEGSLSFTGTFDDAGALIGTGGTAISFADSEGLLIIERDAVVQGVIGGFLPGGTIDLAGIAATSATLGANNVLSVQESGGGTVTLNLAPNLNYANHGFRVTSDGSGGTDIRIDPGATTTTGATTLGHNKTADLTALIGGLVTPGLAGDTETVTAVSATHGAATVVNGIVTYTAPASGLDTLSYTVVDQFGGSAFGSVNVTVDLGPSAGTGATTLGHDKSVNLTSLVNGLITPGLAGDAETVTAVSAAHGSVSVVNGVVTYTAPSIGPDTLSYTVVDQYGDSAIGTVNVTVDRGPNAAAGAITLGHNKPANLTTLINGLVTPGLTGDSETLTAVTAAHGSVTLVNGVVSYTAPSNGPDTLSYTVVDQYGDNAIGTVNVIIDSSISILACRY